MYRPRAKKARERGIVSSPDPIEAGNYCKRAADAYSDKNRLPRIASAVCQIGQDDRTRTRRRRRSSRERRNWPWLATSSWEKKRRI